MTEGVETITGRTPPAGFSITIPENIPSETLFQSFHWW